MHRGYVRDYRKGIEHPLFSRPLIWHFWTYCRLRANHKESLIDFNGMPLRLERGCFLMSIKSASDATGLSAQNIRTAIRILESHKMIEKSTSEVTKQATIIKVINYDTYQGEEKTTNKVSNKVLTKCQQGTNKVPTIDNNVKHEKNVKKTTYSENSDEFRVASYLFKHISKRKPDFKAPDLQKWSEHADKMIRIDKRPIEQIRDVIKWCQLDEFWQNNILSVAKLRKQYDQLVLKMEADGIKKNNQSAVDADKAAESRKKATDELLKELE
jgi:predicted transcriptional regulator